MLANGVTGSECLNFPEKAEFTFFLFATRAAKTWINISSSIAENSENASKKALVVVLHYNPTAQKNSEKIF